MSAASQKPLGLGSTFRIEGENNPWEFLGTSKTGRGECFEIEGDQSPSAAALFTYFRFSRWENLSFCGKRPPGARLQHVIHLPAQGFW